MPDTTKDIDWYNVTKDIIIPLLSVLTTIIVGTIIAYLLKTKEEKAKIKTLLIDNYMLYLNKKVNFFDYELTSFTYQIMKDVFINYSTYFKPHANDHLAKEKIAKLRDKLKQKLDTIKQEDTDWSPFTYKFAFLLGKKNYFKNALPLENVVTSKYLSDNSRKEFREGLKKKIIEDQQIVNGINSSNSNEIDDALDKIEHLITVSYSEFQFKIFNPYDNKIANLIDAY